MNGYCSLEQLRDYLTSSTVDMERWDDAKMMQYITQASRRIDKWCRRSFYPRIETRYFNYQKARDLIVDDDLLAVSNLTAGGTPIVNTDYWLYPLNKYPKWMIQIDRSKSTIFDYASTLQRAVAVEGTWGWHNDWANAWPDSLDTVENDPLTAAGTSITVNDVDAEDSNGFDPRFAPGQLLRIESEYLLLTKVNASNETLTVRRALNGTTAAEHALDTPIYVYQPPQIVIRACLELTKLIYEMRSATGGVIALPALDGMVMRVSSKQLLKDQDLPVRPDDVMEFV